MKAVFEKFRFDTEKLKSIEEEMKGVRKFRISLRKLESQMEEIMIRIS